MCGEKHLYGAKFETKGTSPPRVRGKAKIRHFSVSSRRITPAYAGKSLSLRRSGFCRWDHPRVCGEKVGPVGCVSGWLGSPPRMRGKAPSLAVLGACIGITPAYAGKSTDLQRPRAAQQDHPRVCGEKLSGCVWQQACAGSPPRMRGKVSQPHYSTGRGGITPAYAGKSQIASNPRRSGRDHPRVCGEKSCAGDAASGQEGSPPRMRGKDYWCPYHICSPGITPAYAGKRSYNGLFTSMEEDHPRVCGEKQLYQCFCNDDRGSPPRMRGKGEADAHYSKRIRITPAYAGKRTHRRYGVPGYWDHPRVCGEKLSPKQKQPQKQGSPPRMRGKEFRVETCFPYDGITPAYAGKRIRRILQ